MNQKYFLVSESIKGSEQTIPDNIIPQKAGEIIAQRIEKSPSKRPGMTIAKITTLLLRKKKHPEITSQLPQNVV